LVEVPFRQERLDEDSSDGGLIRYEGGRLSTDSDGPVLIPPLELVVFRDEHPFVGQGRVQPEGVAVGCLGPVPIAFAAENEGEMAVRRAPIRLQANRLPHGSGRPVQVLPYP